MRRFIVLGITAILATTPTQSETFGRGFGGFHGGGFGGLHAGGFGGGGFGGYHAGGVQGGGFHAGGFGGGEFGGYHADGLQAGGYRGGEFGGYHAGGVSGGEFGGYHAGGLEAGGYRGGEFGGYHAGAEGSSVNRGRLNNFLGMPTDSGMQAVGGAYGSRGAVAGPEGAAAWRGGATGHVYQGPRGTTIAHGTAGVHAGAIGAGGAVAGGRVATGTAVKGPGGNVYAHTASAGRGIAVGSGGAVAGGRVTTGRGYAAFGTRYWSPTYCHAQGLAAQRWCAGARVFTPTWSAAHVWAWHPVGYTAAAWARAAWTAPTAAAIAAWIGATAAYVPYEYGDNVTYQNNYVYYGSQPIATPQEYYQQADTIAASQSSAVAAGAKQAAQWLPLGVFGLIAEGQKTPAMIFQLAVDKAGAIRGNYYDQVLDTTVPVTGAVDKKDQRVAWRVGKNKQLVVETGLYNLTKNSSTALVHNGPDQTQQYVLVRLKQPKQE